MGQLPVLYIDGEPLFQSGAIVRYLGAKLGWCLVQVPGARPGAGLAGKNDLEAAKIDAVTSCTEDLMPVFAPLYAASDADKVTIFQTLTDLISAKSDGGNQRRQTQTVAG